MDERTKWKKEKQGSSVIEVKEKEMIVAKMFAEEGSRE